MERIEELRYHSMQCKNQEITSKLGLFEPTYGEILDLLATRGCFCSVFPVCTCSSSDQMAFYPSLIHGDIKNWCDTRKNELFDWMYISLIEALDESIKTAIEIILSENTVV